MLLFAIYPGLLQVDDMFALHLVFLADLAMLDIGQTTRSKFTVILVVFFFLLNDESSPFSGHQGTFIDPAVYAAHTAIETTLLPH